MSFTRAAERLFLTQSAVSHQIAKLERELGCDVLERQGRRVTLTAAGRVLVERSRRVFVSIDEAVEATRQVSQTGSGRLRVGASNTACQYILPNALREFRECFPKYSLSITPGDSPVSLEHLNSGAIDLGIVLRTERNKRIDLTPLFEDELQLIVSPLHPWARAGRVDRRQLGDERIILYGRNSATFRLVEQYFARLRIPLRDWIEIGDLGAIKELVKIGLGISLMAPWATAIERKEGSLISLPMPGTRLKRQWCVASLAGKTQSIAEQTFIGLCRAVARRLA